jgi:hypothetical protein
MIFSSMLIGASCYVCFNNMFTACKYHCTVKGTEVLGALISVSTSVTVNIIPSIMRNARHISDALINKLPFFWFINRQLDFSIWS